MNFLISREVKPLPKTPRLALESAGASLSPRKMPIDLTFEKAQAYAFVALKVHGGGCKIVSGKMRLATTHGSSVNILQQDVLRLKAFHEAHFPTQCVPDLLRQAEASGDNRASAETEDDGLGFYHDGVKRTLTDEQIKMFRHSEIQRLLSERRQARREAEEAAEHAERRAEDLARKRKFYDDAGGEDQVQELSYDDASIEQRAIAKKEKEFLWPKLGA